MVEHLFQVSFWKISLLFSLHSFCFVLLECIGFNHLSDLVHLKGDVWKLVFEENFIRDYPAILSLLIWILQHHPRMTVISGLELFRSLASCWRWVWIYESAVRKLRSWEVWASWKSNRVTCAFLKIHWSRLCERASVFIRELVQKLLNDLILDLFCLSSTFLWLIRIKLIWRQLKPLESQAIKPLSYFFKNFMRLMFFVSFYRFKFSSVLRLGEVGSSDKVEFLLSVGVSHLLAWGIGLQPRSQEFIFLYQLVDF